MPKQFATLLCQFLCLLVISGCREEPGPEIASVEGVVRLNGKPQRGLMVRFLPDPEQGIAASIDATGTTDEQGQYVLEYTYEGNQGKGAPVGWHRVLVIDTTRGHTPQGQQPRPSLIPMEYASPATTPIAKEVKPDGPQTIDIDIRL